MREELLAATFQTFEPDLVLVDYLPGGVWGELVAPLAELRESRPSARVVLGLRDYLDAPEAVRVAWAHAGHDLALRRFYDRVLVYGDRDVFDASAAYGLEDLLPGRVTYTGYLCAEDEPGDVAACRRTLGVRADERLFLVTAGGGADAYPMMSLALRALRVREQAGRPGRAVLVAGPLMDAADVARLQRASRGLPATVLRSTDDLTTLMAASDLVLTMAAYNTLTDALRLQKRVVSVPRLGPSAEQQRRAELFAELKLLTRVPPGATAERLSRAIDEALETPRLLAPPPTLGGLAATMSVLRPYVAEGPAARQARRQAAAQAAGGHD